VGLNFISLFLSPQPPHKAGGVMKMVNRVKKAFKRAKRKLIKLGFREVELYKYDKVNDKLVILFKCSKYSGAVCEAKCYPGEAVYDIKSKQLRIRDTPHCG